MNCFFGGRERLAVWRTGGDGRGIDDDAVLVGYGWRDGESKRGFRVERKGVGEDGSGRKNKISTKLRT